MINYTMVNYLFCICGSKRDLIKKVFISIEERGISETLCIISTPFFLLFTILILLIYYDNLFAIFFSTYYIIIKQIFIILKSHLYTYFFYNMQFIFKTCSK